MCDCNKLPETDSQGFKVSNMVKSLSNGIKDAINKNYVSHEVEIERITICLTCPHRVNKLGKRNEEKVTKTDQCALCWCLLKGFKGPIPPKTKLTNSVCDSGRWLR